MYKYKNKNITIYNIHKSSKKKEKTGTGQSDAYQKNTLKENNKTIVKTGNVSKTLKTLGIYSSIMIILKKKIRKKK